MKKNNYTSTPAECFYIIIDHGHKLPVLLVLIVYFLTFLMWTGVTNGKPSTATVISPFIILIVLMDFLDVILIRRVFVKNPSLICSLEVIIGWKCFLLLFIIPLSLLLYLKMDLRKPEEFVSIIIFVIYLSVLIMLERYWKQVDRKDGLLKRSDVHE